MTATSLINDMRIITVVMGEPDSKKRNEEVSSIFDYVYAQYALNKVIDTDQVIKNVSVEKGKLETVDIVPKENITELYKKSEGKKEITYDIEISNLKAPLEKGDVVGKLILKESNIATRTINLTVKEDVKKANIFELYLRYIKQYLGN